MYQCCRDLKEALASKTENPFFCFSCLSPTEFTGYGSLDNFCSYALMDAEHHALNNLAFKNVDGINEMQMSLYQRIVDYVNGDEDGSDEDKVMDMDFYRQIKDSIGRRDPKVNEHKMNDLILFNPVRVLRHTRDFYFKNKDIIVSTSPEFSIRSTRRIWTTCCNSDCGRSVTGHMQVICGGCLHPRHEGCYAITIDIASNKQRSISSCPGCGRVACNKYINEDDEALANFGHIFLLNKWRCLLDALFAWRRIDTSGYRNDLLLDRSALRVQTDNLATVYSKLRKGYVFERSDNDAIKNVQVAIGVPSYATAMNHIFSVAFPAEWKKTTTTTGEAGRPVKRSKKENNSLKSSSQFINNDSNRFGNGCEFDWYSNGYTSSMDGDTSSSSSSVHNGISGYSSDDHSDCIEFINDFDPLFIFNGNGDNLN